MFKLFSSGPIQSAPTDYSTSSLSVETIPGGPSPDSSISPHNTRHQALASGAADSEDVGAHPQTNKTLHVVAAPTPLRTSHSELGPIITTAPDPNPMPKKANEGSANHSRRRPSSDATAKEGAGLGPSASVASRRTNRSAAFSNLNGSAFANGAATAANEPPDIDPSLHLRAASAEDDLRPREKAAIKKEDHGMGRRLSKIIKSEAKAEKAALHVALKELAEIQKLQKESIKEEAISHTKHSRALSDARKAEMDLLVARTASEREQASLRAAGEVLEVSRKHARETTEMLREKMEEVERLRMYKQVDDRERAVKVKSLVGEDKKLHKRNVGSK